MERKELEFTLQWNHYLKGGTKEACVKVREFLSHVKDEENGKGIHTAYSCVTEDEFIEAVETLIAFAFRQNDTTPERWHCDNDCHRVDYFLCPGECNISKTADRLCPFFLDEGLI